MKIIVDANKLISCLLKDSLTLSLAKYEVGNPLWKEALLQKRISIQEAFETMLLLNKVLKIMGTVNPSNDGMVLKLACELKATFYDASYIAASIENNSRLVTDDEKLTRKIRENANTIVKILGHKTEAPSSSNITG
ncbi:MAG: type II toxin-antitoxin system VapC family toxin [Thermoproteota archaeon]